ncbi:MAG TPA: hypothetical protein VMW65_07205, partial [Chloroflexota bacterium]|nr:hypothetical protein [Chloroflexota bacterium]
VDPHSPTGAYALLVGVYVRDTLTRLPVIDSLGRTAGTQITLGPIKVHGVAIAPPAVPHPQPVQLADGVTFQGYRLAPEPAQPGQALTVTLYWSAQARPSRDYTVFVHLLNNHGQVLAQADSPPQAGDYPTSLWDPSETIVDRHVLTVPTDLPPGVYRLEIGLYQPETGKRLPILDAAGHAPGNRILLSGVQVDR